MVIFSKFELVKKTIKQNRFLIVIVIILI